MVAVAEHGGSLEGDMVPRSMVSVFVAVRRYVDCGWVAFSTTSFVPRCRGVTPRVSA